MAPKDFEFEPFRKLALLWRKQSWVTELPRYEDLARDELAGAESHTALFAVDRGGTDALRVGDAFHDVTRIAAPLDWSRVPRNFALTLQSGVARAAATGQPACDLVRRVEGGNVGVCEIIFLPSQGRDGRVVLVGAKMRAESCNLLETMYRATTDGILIVTPARQNGTIDFQIVSLNAAAARHLGVAEQDATWRMISDFFSPQQTAHLFRRLLAIREGQSLPDFELEGRDNSAEGKHLCVSAVRVSDVIALTLSNVSRLREREESVRRLFDNNPVAHWIYDAETLRIRYVNEAALLRYEYKREDMIGLSLLQMHPKEEGCRVTESARRAFSTYGEAKECTHLTASGKRLDVLVYRRDLIFEGRRSVLSTIVDMTEQRAAERRVQHLAWYDHLTGLANRALFRDRLDATLGAASVAGASVALHALDLDRFKIANDTLGHAAGDRLLCSVAERISANLGHGDLFARIGGDEFAIIQSSPGGTEGAERLAQALVKEISRPFCIDGQDVQIGLSVGIALSEADSADDLLQKSDVALYRAKLEGRQTYRVFEPGMNAEIQAKRKLEHDLRKALARDELSLVYQPLCETRDGRVVGCEALLRWTHPQHGAISPADFIPLAEETGLIVEIGEWVLHKACAEAARWPIHVKLAVNLSPVQFRTPEIVQTVRHALETSGLAPERLEIEITESVLLAANQNNIELVRRLRDLGVRIALDDFGTGYSSLRYLHAFPLDKIKVDRSFVRDLPNAADSLAIVRAIAALGRSLGIRTLAEGVETREQLDCLREEGYDEMQGYLFSPPRDPQAILPLFPKSLAA